MIDEDRQLSKGVSPLEELRQELGFESQEAFARALGIPSTTYYRWITGRTSPQLKPSQIKALEHLLARIGKRFCDLPDDWGPAQTQSA
jgi:DNA-binding transcriptional regulator YiaG